MKLVVTIDASKREPIIIRTGAPSKATVAHIRMFPPPTPFKRPVGA